VASAQGDLKTNLKKHVYTLADDSLMGRPPGSKYMKAAEDYVIKQLEQAGLKVVSVAMPFDGYERGYNEEYNEEYDEEGTTAIEHIVEEEYFVPRTIFAYIEGTDRKLKSEWVILKANMQGYGFRVMDGHTIIFNGANDNLSSVSAVIELANIFAKEGNNKRNIGFIFTNEGNDLVFDYYMSEFMKDEVLEIIKDRNNIKTLFYVNSIGRTSNAEIGRYYSEVITNFEEIVKPFKKREDLFIKTFDEGEVGWSSHPYINLSEREDGQFFESWADEASTLKYDTMTEAVIYIKELVSVFTNTKVIKVETAPAEAYVVMVPVDIAVPSKPYDEDVVVDTVVVEPEYYDAEPDYDYAEPDYDWEEQYRQRNKPFSYFGINAMIGSNKHRYQQGNMTGKQSIAYGAGVFGKLALNKVWGLSLGVNYQRLQAYRHDGKFCSDAVSIPLSLWVGYDERSVGFNFSFGGYYDYIFAGTLAKHNLDFSKFNHSEVGLQCGIHIHISHLMFSWYAKYGLSNVMDKTLFGDMRSITSFFQISYLLP
jgi:hypothetical protein